MLVLASVRCNLSQGICVVTICRTKGGPSYCMPQQDGTLIYCKAKTWYCLIVKDLEMTLNRLLSLVSRGITNMLKYLCLFLSPIPLLFVCVR